jgi:hypothetical protein
MVKIPAKMIKGLMKKLGSGISDAKNTEHEEMIKAMRAKQVPDTTDIEGAMTKPKMAEPAPELPPAIDPEAARTEQIMNMGKADRAKFIEEHKKSLPQLYSPKEPVPPKGPAINIEGKTDDEALDSIGEIMRLMKQKKKTK